MHNRKSITGENCYDFKDLCLCQKRTQQTIFKGRVWLVLRWDDLVITLNFVYSDTESETTRCPRIELLAQVIINYWVSFQNFVIFETELTRSFPCFSKGRSLFTNFLNCPPPLLLATTDSSLHPLPSRPPP